MAEEDLATPSVTPVPVGTDVPTTTDVPPEHAGEALGQAPLGGRSRLDLGHPFVKLGAVFGALLGLCVVASFQSEPTAGAAPASSASPIASPQVATSAPAASAHEARESVPHDVDDDEEPPPPHANRSRGASRHPTTHAPDAKAGVTTGYRAGEPVRVTVTIIDGKPVEEHTAAAFRKMRAAAERAGLSLRVVSGFRTMERQRELYDDYRAGRGHLAALPGHSNHQSGRALDLAVASATVRAWLESHADEFGFRRTVPNEPWHWEN